MMAAANPSFGFQYCGSFLEGLGCGVACRQRRSMLASAAPFGPVATLTLSAWALIIIGCLAAFYSGFGRPARASVTCTRRSARDCCGFTAYAVGYGQDNGLLFGPADRLLCCYLDCFGLRSLQIGCLGLKPCVPTRRALLLKQEASQAPRCSAASQGWNDRLGQAVGEDGELSCPVHDDSNEQDGASISECFLSGARAYRRQCSC
jgi:hypothetical protein